MHGDVPPQFRNLRELDRDDRVNAAIDKSHEVIARDGIDALTIARLARELGWSTSVLYDLFGTRESLLIQMFFEGSRGFNEAMYRVMQGLPADVNSMELLHSLAHGYRQIAIGNPPLYTMAMSRFHVDGVKRAQLDAGIRSTGLQAAMTLVRGGVESGMLLHSNPINTILPLWGAVHGMVTLEIAGYFEVATVATSPEPAKRTELIFDGTVRTVLRGLATPKGIAALDAIVT